MLEQASVEEMFQKYGEMLYKICIVMLENTYDAEDTVQDVLIKYMTKKPLKLFSRLFLILTPLKRNRMNIGSKVKSYFMQQNFMKKIS